MQFRNHDPSCPNPGGGREHSLRQAPLEAPESIVRSIGSHRPTPAQEVRFAPMQVRNDRALSATKTSAPKPGCGPEHRSLTSQIRPGPHHPASALHRIHRPSSRGPHRNDHATPGQTMDSLRVRAVVSKAAWSPLHLSSSTTVGAHRPAPALHRVLRDPPLGVRIAPMQVRNDHAPLRHQDPSRPKPGRGREHRARRDPLEASESIVWSPVHLDTIRLEPPPHDPSPTDLSQHQIQEGSPALPRLDEHNLDRKARRHDQPRKSSPGPHIDPSLASRATQPTRQCHDL